MKTTYLLFKFKVHGENMAKVTQKKTKSAEASAPAKPVTKPAKKAKTENATPVKGVQKKPVKKTENATPAKVIQKKPVKKTKSVTLALVKREQKKVAKQTEAIKKKIDVSLTMSLSIYF